MPRLRISTGTYCVEYTETTCPYCGDAENHYVGYAVGDKVNCQNSKCKRRFIVGDEE